MFKMLALIQNENMKIFRRIRTWMMIGMIVSVNLLMAIIMINIDINPPEHMMEFVSASVGLTGLSLIFSVVVASDIVASEFTWGTVKMLLIRPVNRTKILFSKYIASLIFALILLLTIFVSSIILGFIFFGTKGELASDLTMINILQDYGYSLVDIFMYLTFAFMISSVFRSSALAIALSFIIMFVANTIIGILSALKYNWGKYLFFSNIDLRQYAESRPFFEGTSLGFSIAVLIVYFIIFHLIAWYVFNKRDVSI